MSLEHIYIAQCPADGPVKIGRSCNPRVRAFSLRHEPSALLGRPEMIDWFPVADTVLRAHRIERGLHRQLDDFCIGPAEWYRSAPEVFEAFAALKAEYARKGVVRHVFPMPFKTKLAA